MLCVCCCTRVPREPCTRLPYIERREGVLCVRVLESPRGLSASPCRGVPFHLIFGIYVRTTSIWRRAHMRDGCFDGETVRYAFGAAMWCGQYTRCVRDTVRGSSIYIRPSDGGGGQCGGRLQARLVGGMLESGDGRIVAAVLKEVGVYVYVEASQFLRESCKPRYF